jgi:PhzF family phenazine biosynthesis protein
LESLSFKKIDAFTGASSSGNPAGAVYLEKANALSAEQMQQVAAECKGWVSEVGFVAKLAPKEYWLRYYSCEREVDFCGHATVGIAYDLIKNDETLKVGSSITLSTKNSELEALNHVFSEDAVFISAPPAQYRQRGMSRIDCAKALKIERKEDIEPITTINAGLDTLIVKVNSLESILALNPNMYELKDFCVLHEIDIVLVYTEGVSTKGCAYRTRVFAPRFGYLEDPATGSGNSAFGYYLLDSKKWTEGNLELEQNGSYQHPNYVKLMINKRKDGRPGLLFGGSARIRMQGQYFI